MRLITEKVSVGSSPVIIGGGSRIVVQTMCNTHTDDIGGTLAQCRAMVKAGAQMIRITVPGLQDVPHIKAIRDSLRAEGIYVPIVADIHFSAQTAIEVARVVDKVRINPGNFHKDHNIARERFRELIEVCRECGTAIRIGINHGSLGEYITNLYGNTPQAMAEAAMEWVRMCVEADFRQVVISLKSSNTVSMVQGYRELVAMMQREGTIFPLHVGVTEAGGGVGAFLNDFLCHGGHISAGHIGGSSHSYRGGNKLSRGVGVNAEVGKYSVSNGIGHGQKSQKQVLRTYIGVTKFPCFLKRIVKRNFSFFGKSLVHNLYRSFRME